MRVLIACEESGIVRDAFAARGHDAWSCDLNPSKKPGQHIVGDALAQLDNGWDMLICHPPCQYLCSSGLHWNQRRAGRILRTEAAIEFALALWNAPIAKVCLENPIGCLSKAIRKPDQIIQPYDFGEDASKATCLWLRGLPLLKPTLRVRGRWISLPSGRIAERFANQTDSGQNRLPPSKTRAADRARTYPGIAAAMAAQWSRGAQ